MKKYGVMMRLGDVFCVFGKKARRFKKSDPKLKVPQWCPRRLPMRKLRIYDFQDAELGCYMSGCAGTLAGTSRRGAINMPWSMRRTPI